VILRSIVGQFPSFSLLETELSRTFFLTVHGSIASIELPCVASVSVGFGSKERDFGILPARKMGREPKMKYGGRGGEGKKRLQTNPWILKTPFSPANGTRDWLG